MSDKRIEDVTPDTNVTGTELLPVSDAGVAKRMTVEQVKDFVLTKINAIASASGVDTANDSVFIKQGNALKPVSAATLASAVVDYAFGLASASTLAGTDEIVLSQSDTAKTTTLAALASYMKNAIQLDAFNVHGLTQTTQPLADTDETPLAQENNSVWSTVKTSLSSIKEFIFNGIAACAETVSAEISHSDYFLLIDADMSLKKVSLPFSGIGKGNVVGPSANTDNNIPQWNGTDTKTLKNGLSVASSITSGSSSTQVPTAAAVYAATSGKVIAPSTNTANYIPQWSGTNSKTLKDGVSIGTSVGATPSDAKLLSEKATVTAISNAITAALATGASPGSITTAIATAITNALASGGAIRNQLDTCAKAPGSTTSGYVPVWSSTSKTLDNGKSLVTSVSSSSTDNQVPTAKAVYDATLGTDTSNLVKMTSSTTSMQGKIPKWGSSDKTFDYSGYSVNTSEITNNGSSSELATTNAIMTTIRKAVKVQTSAPSASISGYESGQMIYNKGTTNPGLYINVGTSASSAWVRIVPV